MNYSATIITEFAKQLIVKGKCVNDGSFGISFDTIRSHQILAATQFLLECKKELVRPTIRRPAECMEHANMAIHPT